MNKQNWFNTLAEALDSEGLLGKWDNRAMKYGETHGFLFEESEGKYRYISIYRDNRGMYERPVHYRTDW